MIVAPLPGVGPDDLIKTLQSVRNEAVNLHGGSGAPKAHSRLLAYLEWASQSARMLGYQISEADLASLVLNRRYELLLSSFGTMSSPEREVQRVVNDLVSRELDQRIAALDEAVKTLQSQLQRWSGVGDLVVLDSCFYIHHPDKLEDADLADVAKVQGTTVHVLVPMVIIDELDGLKRQSKQPARWRAGYTVAVLDRVFKNTTVGMLHAEDITKPTADGLGHGRITMELLFDPPGHVRQAINDDEIVERAAAIQALAGRKVIMITYDTGMSSRARNAGLRVISLKDEIGEEPATKQ